jgi:hypothetical protein
VLVFTAEPLAFQPERILLTGSGSEAKPREVPGGEGGH